MNIYLDIDGVLLANDNNAANYSDDFIEYLTTNHTVYWLTTHCHGDASTAVERIRPYFDPKIMLRVESILPTDWGTAKTEAINFKEPFLWFDDDLFDDERKKLIDNNAIDNWIHVDLSKNENQLAQFVSSLPIPSSHI